MILLVTENCKSNYQMLKQNAAFYGVINKNKILKMFRGARN